MSDPFELKGRTITEVTALETSAGLIQIRLTLDNGKAVKFSSTDAIQDSQSCHWHEHPIDCHISEDK